MTPLSRAELASCDEGGLGGGVKQPLACSLWIPWGLAGQDRAGRGSWDPGCSLDWGICSWQHLWVPLSQNKGCFGKGLVLLVLVTGLHMAQGGHSSLMQWSFSGCRRGPRRG